MKITVSQSIMPTITNPSSITHSAGLLPSLSIAAMKAKSYPGSTLAIEQIIDQTALFKRYIVSYFSDGLKIYALLAVPLGKKPKNGWPIILFNHGYIPPNQYKTTESYTSWVAIFASHGYIVMKPDYRGNGNSPGSPTQVYVSPDYVTDSLNALASVKQYPDANPHALGVFGHSMGGNISLHELVIDHDLRAAVIVNGVVGDESGIINWWKARFAARTIIGNDMDTYYALERMVQANGTPKSNPAFWDSIDPLIYLPTIVAPVQIFVGTDDTVVPVTFSEKLRDELGQHNKVVSYVAYPGADHNLSPDTFMALERSVTFFDTYLKQ